MDVLRSQLRLFAISKPRQSTGGPLRATVARGILDVVDHQHVANAEFVIDLDHAEVAVDWVCSQKVDSDGEFFRCIRPQNVVDRFDEDILVGARCKIGTLLREFMDRLVEQVVIMGNGERNQVVSTCLHARQSRELEFL